MNNQLKSVMRYVLPSIGSMLVAYLYVVIDGIFVGQGIGADALAAVNVGSPSVSFMTALVGMMATGSAAVAAVRLGRGDYNGANDAFMTGLSLVTLVSVLAIAVFGFFAEPIARLSGSNDTLLSMAGDYIRYYNMFAPLSALAAFFSVFVRNDGNPRLSFWGMIAGGVANTFLDWLFVFPLHMGVRGAAIASGLGQGIALLILSAHFIKKAGVLRIRRFHLSGMLVGKVLKRGLPDFILRIGVAINNLCCNLVMLRLAGELGLSALAIVGYISILATGIFTGVSGGIQPLIGHGFGKHGRAGAAYFYRAGMVLNVALSVLFYLVLLLFGDKITMVFNNDMELVAMAYGFLRIYAFSLVIGSVNIILLTYFISTKKSALASILALLRGLVLNTALIFTVPMLLGINGLWFALCIVESVVAVIGLFMKHKIIQKDVLAETMQIQPTPSSLPK